MLLKLPTGSAHCDSKKIERTQDSSSHRQARLKMQHMVVDQIQLGFFPFHDIPTLPHRAKRA